jgi:hypothetical protein
MLVWSRWLRTTLVVLASAGCFLMVLGCGGNDVSQVSPDSDQYKEAKKRGDAARAKEYGRKSLDDSKSTVDKTKSKAAN